MRLAGMPPLQRHRAAVMGAPRPPSAEQLAFAEQLLKDGAGYREAATTVHIGRKRLAQLLPGYGLSLTEAARKSRLIRDTNTLTKRLTHASEM